MANRSYLFACASLPGHGSSGAAQRVGGISEWKFHIPLVAQILVSCETQLCDSLIWTGERALAGRYDAGLDRLGKFLLRIDQPAIAPLRAEAMAFLSAQRDAYFVLECGEVFAMADDLSIAEQTARLLRDIEHLDLAMEQTVAWLKPAEPSFWERVFKPAQSSIEAPLRELGLGYWSNTLYFDFASSGAGEPPGS